MTPPDLRSWTFRRIAVYGALAWCLLSAGALAGVAVWKPVSESRIVEGYIGAAFNFALFILIFYILTPSLEIGWKVLANLVEWLTERTRKNGPDG